MERPPLCRSGSSLPRSNDNNDEIVRHISAAVKRKKSALGGHTLADSLDAKSNRPMILIGG